MSFSLVPATVEPGLLGGIFREAYGWDRKVGFSWLGLGGRYGVEMARMAWHWEWKEGLWLRFCLNCIFYVS